MVKKLARISVVCAILSVLPACALFRGANSPSAQLPDSAIAEKDQHEEKLRSLVDRNLSDAQKISTPESARLVFRKPYHFKEYVTYSEGIESYALDLRESDSTSTPYTARIRLPKKRYATKFNKKKSKARRDTTYIESIGIETRSYEMRHGHWRETGSVFIASNSDSRVVSTSTLEKQTDADPESDEEPSAGRFSRLIFWRK